MPKVEDIVAEVSDLLSDYEPGHENVRWSKSSIRHWLQEGYLLASAYATHKNSEIVDVELVEGSVQTLPEGYEEFVRVVSNPGTFEKIADNAKKSGEDRFKGIFDPVTDAGPCITATTNSGAVIGVSQTSATSYAVTGWEAEPMSATTFYVEPPVPKGYRGTVRVLAIKTIDLSAKEAVIPMWAHSLCVDWALHRALFRDVESQYASARSDIARKNFYELLSLFRPKPENVRAGGQAVTQGDAT